MGAETCKEETVMAHRLGLTLAATLGLCAGAANAQDNAGADYTNRNSAATTQESGEPQDVEEQRPARRVIPARRINENGRIFVEKPVVQGTTETAGADFSRKTMPGDSFETVLPVPGPVRSTEEMVQLPVPAGGRIVNFDRSAWLAECRARLATYGETERAGVLDRRSGRQVTSAPAQGDECQAYLDDYMADAMAGTLENRTPVYGQEYMLVPVEIAVPRRPVYRDAE